MHAPSRIEPVRRRVRILRYLIGAVAAAGFAGAAVAARASHPATHHATTAASSAATASSSQDDQSQQQSNSFGFGDSFVSPSQSAPSVQSGGS